MVRSESIRLDSGNGVRRDCGSDGGFGGLVGPSGPRQEFYPPGLVYGLGRGRRAPRDRSCGACTRAAVGRLVWPCPPWRNRHSRGGRKLASYSQEASGSRRAPVGGEGSAVVDGSGQPSTAPTSTLRS